MKIVFFYYSLALKNSITFVNKIIPMLSDELFELFPLFKKLCKREALLNYVNSTLYSYLYHLILPLFMSVYGILY